MKVRFSFVFIAVLLFAFGTLTFAQQQQQDDPMMKAMMAYATPGPEQKAMQAMVGTWDAAIKSYWDPKGPTEDKGTSTYTSLLDGRFIQEDAQGNMMNMPFHGIGTFGYDNVLKKYVGTWIDNMGTGIMTSTGTSPDGGKTVNWVGKGTDPMTGKEQTYKSAMHNMGPDKMHFEMHGPGPDGKEMKMMEITYTRRK